LEIRTIRSNLNIRCSPFVGRLESRHAPARRKRTPATFSLTIGERFVNW
jgi:hypothetical protein